MRINVGRLTYDKLVYMICMLKRQLESVVIKYEGGQCTERKMIALSLEEIQDISTDINHNRIRYTDTEITIPEVLNGIPGIVGMIEDVLVVSERSRYEGVIDVVAIKIEEARINEQLELMKRNFPKLL